MKRYAFLLIGSTTLIGATAFADFATLNPAPFKANPRTIDGYSFAEPVGAETAVPVIFVWSDNKVGYSRVGGPELRFPVRVSQQCTGDDWKQYKLPGVYIGDRHWPDASADGAKPILQDEGHVYPATLQAPLDKLEFAGGFSKDQAIQRCNMVLASHAKDGKLPANLLKEGFWVRVDGAVRAKAWPGCVDPCDKKIGFCEDLHAGMEVSTLPVFLRCMPTGYVETHRLAPEAHRTKPEGHRLPGTLRSVDLRSVNSPLKHVCPATVVFRGAFSANRAVKGSYRIVGSDGYESPAYPYSLAADAQRSISWQRRVEPPAPAGGQLAAPGSGSWPRKAGGWLQLEVTDDEGKTIRSERAEYQVDCLMPPSPGGTLRD